MRTARSGLDFIHINVWETRHARAEALAFADVWNVAGPILLDETGDYAAALGITGVPTNVLVDARGIVRAVGAVTPAELEQAVRALLAE
ncbi:thioredoxin fold domain-containing protein [Streptomyces sp. NEAU-sy36]|uniref:TlpA family protein disulfide reductase n=1 Tax=Streptomyces sp. NEAU-sy36 TaxID=2751189 RepID=UPI0027D86536|nr:thioredoxin fold domain-containing protein [Streptomyces sp. NEAU-sy36]